jgi:hypothetical protein
MGSDAHIIHDRTCTRSQRPGAGGWILSESANRLVTPYKASLLAQRQRALNAEAADSANSRWDQFLD